MFMRPTQLSLLCLWLFILATFNTNADTHKPPLRVVVSITPFYALVAAVMQDIATPQLLVKPGTSPHDYTLKPSDMQQLVNADLIFWGGPLLETFLVKPLNNLKEEAATPIVEFDKAPNLLLLPLRQSAAWDTGEHQHGHEHRHSDQDMHFWLNPNNASILTDMIVHHLSVLDPLHIAIYKKNGAQLKQRLKKLDAHITQELNPVKSVSYIVFHDAYQYFEQHYGLKGVGSITLNPEIPPSAKRLKKIRTIIEQSKAQCVFREPQFQPKLVESIVADLGVRTGELDPIGQASQNNPEGYFTLLENLSLAIKNCLTPNNLAPN